MQASREDARTPLSVIEMIEALDPPLPMMILERGMLIRWVSRAAGDELGLRAEKLEGRCWYDLFPESRTRSAQHQELFSGERASLDLPRIPLRIDCVEPRYFSLRLRPLQGADGTVQVLLGVGEEVTAQVRAEQLLRDNEERFRAISAESRDLILISARDGTITYANDAHDTVLGQRPDGRIGASIFDFMHAEDAPAARAAFEAIIADPRVGVRGNIEIRKAREDGSYRWLQFTARNLLDHPQVRGVVLNGRDITDRKEAELALARARSRLDAALWGARVGLYTVDLRTDKAELSPQFFEITGIDPGQWEADAQPWASRIHARDRRSVLERRAAHLSGGLEAFEAEYRIRTPRGWMWLLDRARAMERDADGRPLTLSGTVIDISARKQLEHELVEIVGREQQRLSQELHDGIGQELAGIALLLRSVVTRQSRDSTAAIAADIDLAIRLLNGSIANARTLAHGLHPVRSDEGGLVGALGQLAMKTTPAHGLHVEFDASNWSDRSLPEDVANHVYRIAQESLSNAMRHASASWVQIRLASTQDMLELTVRDDGRGLPQKYAHAPGLGRRIMNYRAQMIGGSVMWHTGPGGGTEVVLQAPWPASV
jgi:PAS domain S-box-containing protein